MKQWIRLTEDAMGYEASTRIQLPYGTAKELVLAGKAEYKSGPVPASDGDEPETEAVDTEPTGDTDTTTTTDTEDADDTDDSDDAGTERVDLAGVDEVDFTKLTGIGTSKAAEIELALSDKGITTVQHLLDTDLTDLPNIGPSKADDLQELLEAHSGADQTGE